MESETITSNIAGNISMDRSKFAVKSAISNSTNGTSVPLALSHYKQPCQDYQYLYGQQPQNYQISQHHQQNFKTNHSSINPDGSDKKVPFSITSASPYVTPPISLSLQLDDGKLNAYPNSYNSSNSSTIGCGSGIVADRYARLEQSACHQLHQPKSSNQFSYTQYNYPSITNIAATPTTTTIAQTSNYYSPSYYDHHKTNMSGNIQTELPTNYAYSSRTNATAAGSAYYHHPNYLHQQQQQYHHPISSNNMQLDKSSSIGYSKTTPYISQYSPAYYGSNYGDGLSRQGSSYSQQSIPYQSYQTGKNLSSYSDMGGSPWTFNEYQANMPTYPPTTIYPSSRHTKDVDGIYSQDKIGAYYHKNGRNMWQPFSQHKSTSSSKNSHLSTGPPLGYTAAAAQPNNCCNQQQQQSQILANNSYYNMMNHQVATSSRFNQQVHNYPYPSTIPPTPHGYSAERSRSINTNNSKIPNSDLHQYRFHGPPYAYSHSNTNSTPISRAPHPNTYNYSPIYPSRPEPTFNSGMCCNTDLNFQSTSKPCSLSSERYLTPTSSYSSCPSQRLSDINTLQPYSSSECFVQSQQDYSSQIQDLSLSPSNYQSTTMTQFSNINNDIFGTGNSNDSKDSLPSLTKTQSLRDFLTSWNEDEEDYSEKNLNSTDLTFIVEQNQQKYSSGSAPITTENGGNASESLSSQSSHLNHQHYDNQLQFKTSFNTRPKIHVGITVDSSSETNSYMNLPDIVIDIEKSNKDMILSNNSTTPTTMVAAESITELDTVLDTDVDKLIYSTKYGDMNGNSCSRGGAVEDFFKEKPYDPITFAAPQTTVELSESIGIEKVDETNTDIESEIPFTKVILPAKPDEHGSRSVTPSKLRKVNVAGCRKHLNSLRRFRFKKSNQRSKARTIKPYRYRRYQMAQRRFAQKIHEAIIFNPTSLKSLCISVINSVNFRKIFENLITIHDEEKCEPMNLTMIHKTETVPKLPKIIENQQQNEILSTSLPTSSSPSSVALATDNNYQIIPKLSDLCKNALNSSFDCQNRRDERILAKVSSFIKTEDESVTVSNIAETETETETQEVLVINLDEILDSDNIFVVQCDINENILEDYVENDDVGGGDGGDDAHNDGIHEVQRQQQQQQQHEFHPVHLVKILDDDETDCEVLITSNQLQSINNIDADYDTDDYDNTNNDDDDDDCDGDGDGDGDDDENSKVDSLMSAQDCPSALHSNPTSPHSAIGNSNSNTNNNTNTNVNNKNNNHNYNNNDRNHITNDNNNYYISHFDNMNVVHSLNNDISSSATTINNEQHEYDVNGDNEISMTIPSPISLSSSSSSSSTTTSSTSSFTALSVHHEEIVPDNYKKFENEKFLKYMHSKYVQRNISKFYHANKIIKKYKKHLLKKVLNIVLQNRK